MATIFLRVEHPDLPMCLNVLIERANRFKYAGLAMQGLLASTMDERGATAIRAVAKDQGKGVVEVVASTAIGFAEALIAELKK